MQKVIFHLFVLTELQHYMYSTWIDAYSLLVLLNKNVQEHDITEYNVDFRILIAVGFSLEEGDWDI